ncbi:MAG: hemolysin family protein [Verrucomicrobiota bacterium]
MSLSTLDFLLYGVILLVLLFLNALLVACEISMVKVRYSLIEDDQLERLRKSHRVALLLDRAGQVAQVLRFGVLLSTVGLGLVLFPSIFYLAGNIPLFATQPGKTVLVFVTFILAISVISIFGFLVPRGVALAHPQDTLRFTSIFVLSFVRIVTPWAKLLRAITRGFLGLFKLKFAEDFNVLDYEVQIRAMGEEDVALSSRIRNMLRNTLRVRDLEVDDVLLPRNQVKYMDVEDSIEVNLEMARETGHTRFPLCEADLDHCLGLIHIKDIFRQADYKPDLLRIRREILSFEATEPLEQALEVLLQQNVHMALVKDAFGGTLGLITLESILEVLVGDIQDEFDGSERALVNPVGEGAYRVDGLAPLHDIEEALEVDVGETEASTFGGWVTDELGRMPDAGEVIRTEEPALEIAINDVDEKRILSATVKAVAQAEDEKTAE